MGNSCKKIETTSEIENYFRKCVICNANYLSWNVRCGTGFATRCGTGSEHQHLNIL